MYEGQTFNDDGILWKVVNISDANGTGSHTAILMGGIFNHREFITTSGSFIFPKTTIYKISVKGAGSGGAPGFISTTLKYFSSGEGGGEGGTTIIYKKIQKGTIGSIVIGAGGLGCPAGTNQNTYKNNMKGGNTTITINNETFTGYGSIAQAGGTGGMGGEGTIRGFSGQPAFLLSYTDTNASQLYCQAAFGGGNGANTYLQPKRNADFSTPVANSGAGGCSGGCIGDTPYDGCDGAAGHCIIEWYDEAEL